MNTALRYFLEMYDIKVLDTNKRCIRARGMDFFNYDDDKNIVDMEAPVAEPLYTVSIPLSSLESLAGLDEKFYRGANNAGSRFLFRGIMAREEEEKFLRDTNESVKAAYEHYSLLLNLAKNGNN